MYEPSWVQFKYGAWYLPPKSWKKRNADKPLQDPKELKDLEMSEAKKKSNRLVSTFMSLFTYFIGNGCCQSTLVGRLPKGYWESTLQSKGSIYTLVATGMLFVAKVPMGD